MRTLIVMRKFRGFGYQQSKVLLMKSRASEFTLVYSGTLGHLVPKYVEFAYFFFLSLLIVFYFLIFF